MLRNILLITAISVALSCSNQSKKTIPSRMDLSISAIFADSLYTMFPGTLQMSSDKVFLQDPFNRDGFLKIFDRKNGKEISRTGKIGKGPNEWTNPSIGNLTKDGLTVYDAYLKRYVLITPGKIQNIFTPDSFQKIDVEVSKFNYINSQQYIAACFKKSHPFEMVSNGQITPCGQYPIKETTVNAIDCFQGNILIHPFKKLMIYGTFDNPYIAMYSIGKNRLDLVWENQFKSFDYNIVDQRLKWGDRQSKGVSELAFTKDYIVCLVNDLKHSEIRGRDIQTTPKAIYLFDYKGQLAGIFDLPVHTVRVASDALNNIFYAVSLEPDYSIVTYDLSTYGF